MLKTTLLSFDLNCTFKGLALKTQLLAPMDTLFDFIMKELKFSIPNILDYSEKK